MQIHFCYRIYSNSSEDVFIIKTVKNTAPWAYVISDLNGEEVVKSFYEKEPKKKKIKSSLE